MGWIVNILGYFFGELFNFLKNNLFDGAVRAAWFSFYSAFKLLAVGIFIAFLTSFIFLFKNAIDLYFRYVDYLNGLLSGGGHDILRVGFSVLKTLRFFEALGNCLYIFYPILALFLSLIVLKIFLALKDYKVNTISEISQFFFNRNSAGFIKGKKK